MDGGANANFVNNNQTLTATIDLQSTTFANLSLDGFTRADVVVASGRTGTISSDAGDTLISDSNTFATFSPIDGVTSFTLSVNAQGLVLDGFEAQFTAIPEPGTTALITALGLGAFVLLRRRCKA